MRKSSCDKPDHLWHVGTTFGGKIWCQNWSGGPNFAWQDDLLGRSDSWQYNTMASNERFRLTLSQRLVVVEVLIYSCCAHARLTRCALNGVSIVRLHVGLSQATALTCLFCFVVCSFSSELLPPHGSGWSLWAALYLLPLADVLTLPMMAWALEEYVVCTYSFLYSTNHALLQWLWTD